MAPEAANTPLRVDHTRLQKALSLYSTQEKQKKSQVLLAPAARMKTVEGSTAL